MEGKKSAPVRNWLGTLNNPVDEPEAWLKAFYQASGASYLTGQLEKGIEGTRHIQYFVNFKVPVRITKLKKLC